MKSQIGILPFTFCHLLIILCYFPFAKCFSQDSSLVFNPNRIVKLEGGSNFRDLGGYPTQSGKTVAWHKIYRSADISKLTENDLNKLNDLHIATDCDLRGPSEIRASPDKSIPHAAYLNLPAGSENVQTGMNALKMNGDSLIRDLYSRTDFLKAKFAPLFENLLNTSADSALMFHCTAGKDRTGIATALILSALGVDRKYIVADYEATNVYWKSTREKYTSMLSKMNIDQVSVQKMLVADPEYIQLFFKTIDTTYGSMDNFLEKELDLSPTKMGKLKGLYVR